MRIPQQQQQQRAAGPPRGHSPAPGTSAMHKPAAQCEKRKESVSPPPERERDIPPKLPSTVYDPMLHCHYRIGDYLGKVSVYFLFLHFDVESMLSDPLGGLFGRRRSSPPLLSHFVPPICAG